MARIEAQGDVEAPTTRVWGVLADLESQPEWMADARSVTVPRPERA